MLPESKLSLDIQVWRARNAGEPFYLDAKLEMKQPIIGIMGASGSGKTTFLQAIAGIVKPDAGHVKFNHQVWFDSKSKVNRAIHQREIGMVFQEGRLFPHLTVLQNLRYGMPDITNQQALDSIVDLLDIKALLRQKPEQLSGGEKQRVAIGRAILRQPKLILMDEPLASLDDRLKQQILPYLQQVLSEVKIPIIYVSHSRTEIETLTDVILQIQNSELVAVT